MQNSDTKLNIVMASYNEEENLEAAVNTAIEQAEKTGFDFNVLIVDDCSTDKTQTIGKSLAEKNDKVSYVRHEPNKGFGASLTTGLEHAKSGYICVLPGDNEISPASVYDILSSTGKADMILPFTVNTELRTPARRFLSRLYTLICNTIYATNVQYFNGPALHRVDLLKNLTLNTNNFAFQTEVIIELLERGYSFIDIPMYLQPKRHYRSSALKLKNVFGTIGVMTKIYIMLLRSKGLKRLKQKTNRIYPSR